MSEHLLLELVGEARAPVELPRSGVLTLGSGEKADLVLEGQGVAAVHCAIGRVKGGGWALKDLGSEYGTIVDGKRVQSARLAAGHTIVIGSRRLRIVERGAVAPAAPSAPVEAPPAPKPTSEAPAPRPAPARSGAPKAAAGLPDVKGYRIEARLGRGSMGEVFLAVQESLERKVAIKVLSPRLAADADFVKSFQDEARAAAALNHPNVVTVHDVWAEGSRHLLAMEYMDRGNLETRLAREGRIAPKEVIDILTDAAKGLVFAEMRGIVHRDIKPANLMQNEIGTIKLADLGLALHLEAEAEESDSKKIFGTPHFISPEQARGEPVDGRSDLYSLGATAYRLLSGHTPFEGSTTRDILRGHFFESPTPLNELEPTIPPDLARIVHRLLEKAPEDRFPSAGALLQELERLRTQVVHGVAATPAGHRRSKSGLLVGVAGTALVVVAGVMAWKTLSGGGAEAGPADGELPVTPTVGAVGPTDPGTMPTDPGAMPAHLEGGGAGDEPADDDDALMRLEDRAAGEYLQLATDLTPDERRSALLALAEEFAGTTAATRFRDEARRIEGELRDAKASEAASDRIVADALGAVRAAGDEGGQPLPFVRALPAMLAAPIEPGLLSNEAFTKPYYQLLRGRVTSAVEAARAELARLDELAKRGEFDDVERGLRDLQASIALPELPGEVGLEQLPELADVNGLRTLVQGRLDDLPAARERFAESLVLGDARAIAAGMRGTGGLLELLSAFDFEAARERLSTLAAAARTDESRALLERLARDAGAAREALTMIAREFGNWRRKTIRDPRKSKRAEAVGADAGGLRLELDGAPERVPWSAFAGRTTELDQLFHQRLERDYRTDELRGIEALMRQSAVLQALEESSEMFDPTEHADFTPSEVEAMLSGFEEARGWTELLGGSETFDREERAARLLAHALTAATDEAWAAAVADLERLLADYGDTLLVLLLSDGRPFEPTPPPVPPQASAEPEAGSDAGGEAEDDGEG